MNYKELLTQVADDANVSYATAKVVVDTLRNTIIESMNNGDHVKIPRLGSFQMIKYSPTRRRDPASGDMWEIPARQKPKFRFSSVAEEYLITGGK